MLADLIRQFPESPEGRKLLPPPLRTALEAVGRKLDGAQMFVLQRDAVMMVQDIMLSSPRRFAAALGVCRLPFPVMWVEFAYKDRDDWLRAAEAAGRLYTVDHKHAKPPRVLGFLLEQVDPSGRLIQVTPAWTHEPPITSICQMSLMLDTRPDFTPLPTAEQAAIRRRHAAEKGLTGRDPVWLSDPQEADAAVEIESRIEAVIPDFHADLWTMLAVRNPAVVSEMRDLARFDLRSEWGFILALLTTLNSRNVIDYGPLTDLSKLNKQRLRSGKKPLLEHRPIRLSLSKGMRHRMASGQTGSHGADVQAHLVMGHWKLRKSGLFWWQPHIRGTVGVVPGTRVHTVSA